MAPKSASASARNGSQKPKKDQHDGSQKPKKGEPTSPPSAQAGTSEGTPATYAPGVRPDKRLYDEEQGKLKAEIDALQSKLVWQLRFPFRHFH